MNKTQVYVTKEDFDNREDKSLNGVSESFLEALGVSFKSAFKMNFSNTGCWNCTDCTKCRNCNHCHKCINCRECTHCNNYQDTIYRNDSNIQYYLIN